jgi:hypothetical protein
MSGSGKAPVPNNQLVIYEPANWDVIYNGQNIERRSTTVENAPQWLIRLCQRLEKAEQDVRSLALAAANTDAMEIDITELRTDYEAMSQAAATLLGNYPKQWLPRRRKRNDISKRLCKVASSSATIFGTQSVAYETIRRARAMPSQNESIASMRM